MHRWSRGKVLWTGWFQLVAPRPWLEHADLAPTMEGFPVAQMVGTLGQNETLPTFTFGLITSPPRGAARLRRCRHVSQG